MRLSIDSEGTHKTAIVGALAVLVGKDEAESLSLGQSAYCRCGMQRLYQFTHARIIK